jgi:hypothetical protein
MNTRTTLARLGILVLVLTSLPTFAHAADSFKDVFVINGTDRPVPTQAVGTTPVGGTVAVSNLPANQQVYGEVNAVQSGEWTVGLAGTPEVQLGPVEPVAFQCTFDLVPPHNSDDEFCYPIPEGKRLVIETVSVAVFTAVDESSGFVLARRGDRDRGPLRSLPGSADSSGSIELGVREVRRAAQCACLRGRHPGAGERHQGHGREETVRGRGRGRDVLLLRVSAGTLIQA